MLMDIANSVEKDKNKTLIGFAFCFNFDTLYVSCKITNYLEISES